MRFKSSILARSRYCFAVVLIVASLLLPLFIAVGRAEALPPANIDEKVTQWLYYRGIWSCIGNFGEESNDDYTLSQNDVMDGKWFHDDKKGFGYIGPSLDDADITKGDDNEGTVDCKDGSAIDRATEDYFGFTNEVEFLCAIDDAMDDLGAKDAIKPAIGDDDCEESGSWDIKSSKDGGDGNWRSALTTVLTESLADQGGRPRFHLGDNADSEAWYYWIGRRGLEIFCGNGKSISEGVESPAGSSKDIVDVTYVDTSTGEVTSGINYFLANTSREQGSKVDDAYYGKGTTSDASDRTCLQLAALTNDNADDFEDYVKANPDEGPSIDTDIPGGNIGSSSNSPLDVGCGGGPDDKLDAIFFVDNVINWITCPIIIGFVSFVHTLENQIVNMLCVNEAEIFGSATTSCSDTASSAAETSAGYKAAWNVFRIIALALLAITGLIMVLAQAAGLEIFDAYTVRKTLPRLLIAAIGISLSWPLLQFFVGFTNDLGIGIRALIYAPFNSRGISDELVLGGGGGAIAKLFAVGYLVSLGIFGTLLLAASAALAVLIAFAVLIIRNILIVALIIFAPIAIVMYILPNTQGIWKTWWSFFSKALLMFPIIMAFIAIGHVFAAIALSGNPSFLQSLIGFGAYFAPYFLLPATFRFAGGAIATIGGFANDRSRGVFDGLRNRRGAIQADRFKRAQSESLWDKDSRLGRAGNRMASWASDPLNNYALTSVGGNTPGLRKRSRSVAGQIAHAKMKQSGELFEELNKMGYNDKAFRALSGAHGGFKAETQAALRDANLFGRAPTSIQDIDKMAKIIEAHEGATGVLGNNALSESAGRLATLYQDQEMTKANIGAAGIMGLAAHGFASGQDLADAGNVLTEGKQHNAGFAQAVLTQSQLMGQRSRPDVKPGYGIVYKDGEFINGMSEEGGRARSLVKTLSSGDLAQAKGGAFDALQDTLSHVLDEGGGEAAAVRDQLFSWAGPYSQASVDVKGKAIDYINARAESDKDFAAAWAKYQREEDPTLRRGGRAGAPEPPSPGGMGQSGPPAGQ